MGAPEFVVEAFTLLGVAALFAILRTVSRLMSVGIKQFQFDDYLMWFAMVRSRILPTLQSTYLFPLLRNPY